MTDSITTQTARIRMRGITQRFGDITVLHAVDLAVRPGEIRALVGQNGAGKSTLMKILGGVHVPTAGTVEVDGQVVRMSTPRDALHAGIGMIYQELSLVRGMSVAENIALGIEPGAFGYSAKRTLAVAEATVARVPMLRELRLDRPIESLSTGFQQRVEIAKAIARDVRVLVLDEPTARLSGPERADLRGLILQLASQGIAIVFISHFLEEVFDMCTDVTVLRNGRVVESAPITSFTLASLTRAMLNDQLAQEELDAPAADPSAPGDEVVRLTAVSGARIADVDLVARSGEIVGLAGLVGSGRTRLARTLAGAERVTGGTYRVHGTPVRLRSPRHALALGIGLIPENRKVEGIIGSASALSNLLAMSLDRGMSRFGVIRRAEARRAARAMFADMEIRPARPELATERFSGGNQQKILLGRAFLAKPSLIVADQPTAGVDVGTKAQIHRLLKQAAADGMSVVVVSDDLEELLALSDRIGLMRRGRLERWFDRDELTRQLLVDAISADAGSADAILSDAGLADG